MKTTVNQGQSLLERYHNALPVKNDCGYTYFPERMKLKVQLQDLIQGALCHEAGQQSLEAHYFSCNKELLKEFDTNFTYKYKIVSVRSGWCLSGTYEHYQDVHTKEQLVKYLRGDIDKPEIEDANDIEFRFDMATDILPEVRVYAFQPKEVKEKEDN